MAKAKVLTLLIPTDGKRVLLGLKKRGFGEGYYNGFGGKVEPSDESVEAAARRELEEEAGVTAKECVRKGLLRFHFDDKPVPWEVHVFTTGLNLEPKEPKETEEMKPQWFAVEDIPYQKMWADDEYWYPLLLAGKEFEGDFYFENTHKLVRHHLRET
ncbi:7,8-dihydro-8-oxoguanine triphosphatase [Chloropicon primus]|uniref:Oxidized purine nucleoside triphosphate hydrolase n=1 Tax=Chloropicon primus TaxID=1764295 RepID=A0A5B8MU10_9CHLO|nr:7,8-dihydro-8-oxoguanine triphosphatase [Chloropicon primus]UPR02146.1 7,8-dihydro-8-oxoguanine triphosphatase [Chloropicon primus]|mmetsp:Transcript_4097/g.11902  ORF Transcript_4097/g.11902 Transcript_4097/m.11902 type:complete len:157 (+) Transcript_4097:172-642(+)|eukprot:QDZ22922.1 7,8-dihydro-8-oxoguanine triphosphatase [Chloropicon primus]